MKILAIVYKLGGVYPTGVTNKRVLDALRELGHDVYVISAPTEPISWHNDHHLECSDFPTYPSILFTKLGNLFQYNLNLFFWEKRVYREAIKKIKSFKPDYIYARSTPSVACRVASKISKASGVPLLMHFTDPIPAPIEWASNKRYRSREIKLMEKILPYAYKVSFGNEAMLRYEQSILTYDFLYKSFVSPDPSPSDTLYYRSRIKQKRIVLTFLGAFHGNRKPDKLFKAIEIVSQKGYDCCLKIYDENRLGTPCPNFVSYVGRTNDVRQALLDSDILVDVEGCDSVPVFISSKLKDYLCCCRPILAILVKDGPSYNLVNNLLTVSICSDNEEIIADRIIEIYKKEYSETMYKERIPVIEQFNPINIAKRIIDEISK